MLVYKKGYNELVIEGSVFTKIEAPIGVCVLMKKKHWIGPNFFIRSCIYALLLGKNIRKFQANAIGSSKAKWILKTFKKMQLEVVKPNFTKWVCLKGFINFQGNAIGSCKSKFGWKLGLFKRI